MSESPRASSINGNLEEMHNLRIVDQPLLTFRRLSPQIEAGWLKELGPSFEFSQGVIDATRELDNSSKANLKRLLDIGTAYGARDIIDDDFPAAFDLDGMTRTQASPT